MISLPDVGSSEMHSILEIYGQPATHSFAIGLIGNRLIVGIGPDAGITTELANPVTLNVYMTVNMVQVDNDHYDVYLDGSKVVNQMFITDVLTEGGKVFAGGTGSRLTAPAKIKNFKITTTSS